MELVVQLVIHILKLLIFVFNISLSANFSFAEIFKDIQPEIEYKNKPYYIKSKEKILIKKEEINNLKKIIIDLEYKAEKEIKKSRCTCLCNKSKNKIKDIKNKIKIHILTEYPFEKTHIIDKIIKFIDKI